MPANSGSKKAKPEPVVIGWREYIALPDWGIDHIHIKADTGARTSAIDVASIEELPNERVRFAVVVDRADPPHVVKLEADIVRRTRVKSSFGRVHDRLVVRTRIQLGPIEKLVELSLVSRKTMLVRVLLGRHALRPEFLVNPARIYVFGRRLRSKKPPQAPPKAPQ